MERGKSTGDISSNLSRYGSRTSVRSSSRMKKAAPPPPRRASSGPEYRQPRPCPPCGEESAIDERLEGRIDLDIVMPDCRVLRLNVDRRTPMMDVLVQATTSQRIPPGGLVLSVPSKERTTPYQPNTPVGSLDATTLCVLTKDALDAPPLKRMPKIANQPFEQTFRLQVNLPRSQRMVVRVSPRSTLAQLKQQVCAEKELDPAQHTLVHPALPGTPLDLAAPLQLYGCAEITLASSADLSDSIRSTYNNIYPKTEIQEEKKRKGILRLFSRKRKDFSIEATNGQNYLHTSQSDNTLNRNSGNGNSNSSYQPKQSLKRKPAPAPPPAPLLTQSSASLLIQSEAASLRDEVESSSHSRHSSDSSGYHEPSVFSDCSENKSPEASSSGDAAGHSPLRRPTSAMATTNLGDVPSCSSASIASSAASRKRRAPQPPLPAIASPVDPTADPLPEPEEESEAAIRYLEDVLQQQSEPFQRVLDDSDDEHDDVGESVSVCTAEVHAPDDSLATVAPPPQPPSPPPTLPQPSEAVDADDSGLSHSVHSDADSSLPSLGSDLRTDSGCRDEIYCNLRPDYIDANLVPSNDEFSAQNSPINSAADDLNHSYDTSSDSSKEETPSALDAKSLLSMEISESETSVEILVSSVKNPEESVEIPDSFVENSEESVEIPDSPVKNPDVSVKNPDSSVEIPDSSVEISNASTEIPDAHIEIPDVTASTKQLEQFTESEKCDSAPDHPMSDTSSVSSNNSVTHRPRKLDNFALGCYATEETIDIYGEQPSERQEVEAPPRKFRNQAGAKRASFQQLNGEGAHQTSSGPDTLPLSGRSTSLLNLTPLKGQVVAIEPNLQEESEIAKRTTSQQQVSKEEEAVELKSSFRQEQKRLHEEYLRLQEQFMSWQKQLMSNQSLLQNEKIVPQMTFPSFEMLDAPSPSAVSHNESSEVDFNSKTRSLPRPKTKPLSLKEPKPSVPSPTRTETTIVDIDIEPSLPAQRPGTLSTSVSTEMNTKQEDKIVQVPTPEDKNTKNTQVPSPQDRVTSGTQAPSPETVLSKDTQTGDSLAASSPDSSPESDNSKSQTLPRPRPKPVGAPQRTMTLNRGTRPKSAAVAVTIGSWQQRQMDIADIEPSSVASSRSKFLSLENIPQNIGKPVGITMEKRKLPPVPIEVKDYRQTSVLRIDPTVPKTEHVVIRSRPSNDSTPDSDKKPAKVLVSDSKSSKTVPKQIDDDGAHKQNADIKVASREPTATFKLAKPFVKLSSMKDEPHAPSIIGLKKWPLADIAETRGVSTEGGRQSIVEDLRASSKKPGGFVQEKIRRAEVDLRKPKSSKVAATEPQKPVEAPGKHITKVNLNASKVTVETTLPKTASSSYNSNYSSNTVPKSRSLNTELMSVFSKKAAKTPEETKPKSLVETNSQPPPPPPPPPPSNSFSIPPAEQIPASSRLLMAGTRRDESRKPSSCRTADPREELMLEIRGFGGKLALKKAPGARSGWNLKVFGNTSTVNS